MKNIKKLAAITIAAGGLAMAGAGVASADTPQAEGGAVMSPGVVSGNNVQVPVRVPVNVCGDTVTVIGGMNMAMPTPCVAQ
ncbi:chaplin [Streptomyces sp. NEAU-Y11]|uniref:chaplin n=1 Tax=Streptomyces cucumeris TaxID=2962890 RepID=UPI0020C85112|nr:chaplin [Streptomyces sp. NEAU-Y11]MCP9212720.1 chaplin [Streptomyces sp. NEAU-Y11]